MVMDTLSMVLAELEATLGREAFPPETRARVELSLRQQIGGERHYIASANALIRADLHARIRTAVSCGMSHTEAAERFGFTRQGIWKICAATAAS
jgi:hypothetical protein